MRKTILTISAVLFSTTMFAQSHDCEGPLVRNQVVSERSIIEVINTTEDLIEWIKYDNSVLPVTHVESYLDNLNQILTLLEERENEEYYERKDR
jgi:hypothetical protein